MKRKILLYPVIFMFFAAYSVMARALSPDDIISETAVLMDAKTGQIIFDKDSGKRMYPASTTKIMTGLLAAENGPMDEMAMVTKSAVDIDVWDSANIALVPDEQLPVDSLMYALMLASANDAANVLAEHVAGTQSEFVNMMNSRALKAGAEDTRFANAHGLHDDGHYTTARDIALITREAIKNPIFMQYFGAGTRTIPSTNLQPLPRNFTNYNYMLVNTTRFYDPGVAGGKVGYTLEARHTMSTVAVRDGRTLVCVVLNSPNRYDKFNDTRKLFDFGFGEFTEVTVARDKIPGFSALIMDGETELGTADFTSPADFTALIHSGADMSGLKISYSREGAFEADEDISAFAEFTIESGNPAVPSLLGRLPLNADVSLLAQAASAVMNLQEDLPDEKLFESWLAIPIAVAGIAALALLSLFIAGQVKRARIRKRRRQRIARIQQERETERLERERERERIENERLARRGRVRMQMQRGAMASATRPSAANTTGIRK